MVEYHAASDPESSFETQVVARDVFSTTLDGLTSSTEYDVRVRGENAVGRSVPSVTMRTKTVGELIEGIRRSYFPGCNGTVQATDKFVNVYACVFLDLLLSANHLFYYFSWQLKLQ